MKYLILLLACAGLSSCVENYHLHEARKKSKPAPSKADYAAPSYIGGETAEGFTPSSF